MPVQVTIRVRIIHVFTVCATIVLCGCGELVDERKLDSDVRVLGGPAQPITMTSEPATITRVPVSVASKLDSKAAVGGDGSDSPTGTNKHQDFVYKADSYWKIYWIQQDLDAGKVPDRIDEVLEEIETKLGKTVDDSEKGRLVTAISDIREGLEALRVAEDLRNMGEDPETLPWGTGKFSMEERFKRQSVDSSSEFSIKRSRPADQSKAIEWESRFHASPRTIEKLAYRRVADAIDYLKNSLEEKGKEFGDTLDPDKVAQTPLTEGLRHSLKIPPLPGTRTRIEGRR